MPGRRKSFKIIDRERVREGTYKFTIDAGSDGMLRVIVYPEPLPIAVFGPGDAQWLQSDLTESQQQLLRREAKRMLKEDPPRQAHSTRHLPKKTPRQLDREIAQVLARKPAQAGARMKMGTKIGTSPAGVEWIAYRPEDVAPMTTRLNALLKDASDQVRAKAAQSPPRMRHLYVLTIRDGKGTKLAEPTGRSVDGNAEMRVWNASQRKWQKGRTVVKIPGYFVDERPAREADLKRYGFTLPAGQYLAS